MQLGAPLSYLRGWKPGPGAPLMGVWFAVALHGLWALLLLFSDAPEGVTAVYALAYLFPANIGLSIVLLAVAGCATYAILENQLAVGARVALLAPQQVALAISAAGAVRAMWLGEFADGVTRSHVFLIVDQAPAVIALFIHSATILYLGLTDRWREAPFAPVA